MLLCCLKPKTILLSFRSIKAQLVTFDDDDDDDDDANCSEHGSKHFGSTKFGVFF
jgi:hypothetical protein